MTKHIGILACSAEGAALCYRSIAQIAAEEMGRNNHPEISMHSIPMAEWMPAFEAGDWKGVGRFMLRSVDALARSGAEFVICPDNSAHLAWNEVVPYSSLPWLHIAEEVGKVAKARGFKTVGLLGTRFTMSGPVYRDAFSKVGLQITTPVQADQREIDRVIWDELVQGCIREESRLSYNSIIDRLKISGCDSVILGCTEIPLLVREDDCPLPTLDSTRLLARAAVYHALGKIRRS
jgi:aspartate racemase